MEIFNKVVTQGDKQLAAAQIPLAHSLMFKLKLLQGALPVGQLTHLIPGGYIRLVRTPTTATIFIDVSTAKTAKPITWKIPFDILSGIVRGGALLDGAMQTFKKVGTTTYEDSKRLARPPATEAGFVSQGAIDGAATQVGAVRAGLYTGKMRALVQLMLGYGYADETEVKVVAGEGVYTAASAVPVLYDYRFDRTHGIYTLPSDGSIWVIEVSRARGVLAQPLATVPGSEGIKDAADKALSECGRLFGGLPAGTGFPTDADLETAITAGKVLRLATASALNPFYAGTAYSTACGWSFNQSGSEAHNVCSTTSGADVYGSHFKLAIEISADKTNGTATLTTESEEKIVGFADTAASFVYNSLNYLTPGPQAHYWEPLSDSFAQIPFGEGGTARSNFTPVVIGVGFDANDTLYRVLYHIDNAAGAGHPAWTGAPRMEFYTDTWSGGVMTKSPNEDTYDPTTYAIRFGPYPQPQPVSSKVRSCDVLHWVMFPEGHRDAFTIATLIPESTKYWRDNLARTMTVRAFLEGTTEVSAGGGAFITTYPVASYEAIYRGGPLGPISIPAASVAGFVWSSLDELLMIEDTRITRTTTEPEVRTSHSVPFDSFVFDATDFSYPGQSVSIPWGIPSNDAYYPDRQITRFNFVLNGTMLFPEDGVRYGRCRLQASCLGTEHYVLSKNLTLNADVHGVMLAAETADTPEFFNFVGYVE